LPIFAEFSPIFADMAKFFIDWAKKLNFLQKIHYIHNYFREFLFRDIVLILSSRYPALLFGLPARILAIVD
jgi:hypothetical protein